MAKFLVLLALTLVVALAVGEEVKVPTIKENQFLLNVWRGKKACEGAPTLPISLINDATKCQVVLKGFIFAKGSCVGDKLSGQVCTDSQCQNCHAIPDVAPQNACQAADFIGGSYKYTCKATAENVTLAKEAPKTTTELNQTLGEKAKEKLKEQASTQELRDRLLDRNLDRNVDRNLDRDVNRNIDRNINIKIDRNVNRRIIRDVDRDVDRDIDRDIDRDTDRDVDRNMPFRNEKPLKAKLMKGKLVKEKLQEGGIQE